MSIIFVVLKIRNQQSWIVPEIYQIGVEGNSFPSIHVNSTRYCATKAAKTIYLHTSSSEQKYAK